MLRGLLLALFLALSGHATRAARVGDGGMFDMVRGMGGHVDGRLELRVEPRGGVRGVFAARGIRKGDLLLRVPWRGMLTAVVVARVAAAGDGEEPRELFAHVAVPPAAADNSAGGQVCALIRLLRDELLLQEEQQRGNGADRSNSSNSGFAPYIRTLGEQRLTMPAAWLPRERATLATATRGTLPPHAAEHARSLIEFWRHGGCGGGAETGRHGERAALLVLSRAVAVGGTVSVSPAADDPAQSVLASEQSLRALVPVFDLFNHRNSAPATASGSPARKWHSARSMAPTALGESFAMHATRDVRAGEELFVSYGRAHPYSSDVFRDYGFVEQLPQRWFLDGGGGDGGGDGGEGGKEGGGTGGVRLDWRVLEGGQAGERVVAWAGGKDGTTPGRDAKLAGVYVARLQRALAELALSPPPPTDALRAALTPNQRLAWEYRAAYESAIRLALAAARHEVERHKHKRRRDELRA